MQHAELVAAEAGDRVAGRGAPREPRPDLLQQLVAVDVAERVVDLLEAVEVHEHHADPGAGRAARSASAWSTRSWKSIRFGQPGQRVVERLVLVDLGLAADLPRRARHDLEEERVEDAEPEEREQRDLARLVPDGGLDPAVRHADLHGALGLPAPAEAERHVDLEAVTGPVGDDIAVQGRPVLVRDREDAAADLLALPRVDHAQRPVPDRERRISSWISGRPSSSSRARTSGSARPC